MLTFNKIYHPLTSRPFLSNETYAEHPPCEALQPYVACYWTNVETKNSEDNRIRNVLVIPDTCMDIIIYVNHTKQKINGFLCSIQDQPFVTVEGQSEDVVSCFAIRFHFWAANLFLKLNLKDTHNRGINLNDLDPEWREVFAPFYDLTTTKARINWVESFLLKKLDEVALNAPLFNSFKQIISTAGQTTVREICRYSCISQRQMERLFLQEVGLPIKRMSRLVRYQNVWREMLYSQHFDIQDAVHRYHYTDQAHLLKDFKAFHGVPPEEARKIAFANR